MSLRLVSSRRPSISVSSLRSADLAYASSPCFACSAAAEEPKAVEEESAAPAAVEDLKNEEKTADEGVETKATE